MDSRNHSRYDLRTIRWKAKQEYERLHVAPRPDFKRIGCRIYVDRCETILPRLLVRPNLIFADPPFNIGHPYHGYVDRMPWDAYTEFTRRWLRAAEFRLADNGVLAINVPDAVVPLILRFASLDRVAWIIWHYRFGQCTTSNWINSKTHCLVFAKNPDTYTWNPDSVLVSSDRASKYGDKRTRKSSTPGNRVPLDVWGIPSDGPYWGRVQGNSDERRSFHPNQLPEVYLERLIRAYTNPGDLVLDPFAGSGTTLVVSDALDRKSIGIELVPGAAMSAWKRITKIGSKRIEKPESLHDYSPCPQHKDD